MTGLGPPSLGLPVDIATDGTDRLRSVATEDIKPLVKARRETSEQESMTFIGSQLLPHP